VTYTILANPSAHRLHSMRPQLARKILLLGETSQALDQALGMLIERYGREDIEITLVENGHDGGKKPATERWLQRYSRRITLTGLPVKELLARLGQPGLAYDFAILAGYGRGDDKSLLIKALRCPIILIA
jgi:hypothetical protein